MRKPTIRLLCKRASKKLTQVFGRTSVRKGFLWGTAATLLITTIYWSVLGASLHSTNADQLIDGYLFADKRSFEGALFPSAHSMLLKWPLFWLVGALGTNGWPLVVATVTVSVAAVAGLAWLFAHIEKRPLVLGSWYLALANVLLLVPLQPYSSGILPVQMAMLTTRNIEYLAYIGGLVLLLRANHWRTLNFAGGVALLGLLAASDRLFIGLGLGGAILLTVYAWLLRNRCIARTSYHLIAAIIGATVLSAGIQTGMRAMGLLTETSGAAASPYPLIKTTHELLLAVFYAVTGILTNFGANPAFDALVVRDTVGFALRRLWSIAGIGYVINGIIFGGMAWCVLRLTRHAPKQTKKSARCSPLATRLSLMLISSAVAATALFVVTRHYYTVDARYLTIWLFAGFVAATTNVRGIRLKRGRVGAIGIVLFLTLPMSVWGGWQAYTAQYASYDEINQQDQSVIRTLGEQKINVLVGDYWRVLPIRAASKTPLTVAPLGSCTGFRDTLTSTTWKENLGQEQVAYLLPLEKSLTGFPACEKTEVIAKFGDPSRTLIISGTIDQPKELLLVYDKGFYHSDQPKTLSSLASPQCKTKSIVQVVAHTDDDLLFFNPDLQRDIRAKHCVRTVFLTAGDSGGGPDYWRQRQNGIRAAYNHMLDSEQTWNNQIVRFDTGQELLLSSPNAISTVTLAFMNMPDGNPHGSGFGVSAYQSLQKLLNGEITHIKTVGDEATYTSAQLLTALDELFLFYKPAEVRTFAIAEPDHSDHLATGNFVRVALQQSARKGHVDASLQTYLGYSVEGFDENVTGDDFAAKETTFYRYGNYDNATCNHSETCMMQTIYGTYLTRQYRAE